MFPLLLLVVEWKHLLFPVPLLVLGAAHYLVLLKLFVLLLQKLLAVTANFLN
ncbi:hypothetical protein N44_00486 [Microcystis aeruginosa NIES-44]|jgi:hypothetical protein|uniref:Uncharacterized protein n=1 Tax=Microcystis aeruginosa NIES-44 TaxID=449439 RepID=A0A0A1VRW3_MICAE|nr:hypothetical protein N44_00486 [Microcystis aeruginosa NIES-44]